MIIESRKLARIAAVISFVICLCAGIWILTVSGFDRKNVLTSSIGLYFIGKAFFVGPLLLVNAERSGASSRD